MKAELPARFMVLFNPALDSAVVEKMYLDNIQSVKESVNIPVSVKLSPYFSAFANMAIKMENAGANGLVLFNRFYQPDINLEKLEVMPSLELSKSLKKTASFKMDCHIKAASEVQPGCHNRGAFGRRCH